MSITTLMIDRIAELEAARAPEMTLVVGMSTMAWMIDETGDFPTGKIRDRAKRIQSHPASLIGRFSGIEVLYDREIHPRSFQLCNKATGEVIKSVQIGGHRL